MREQNSFTAGLVFALIGMIFLMNFVLFVDHFYSKYRPEPLHQPVCDDQYQIYYFLLEHTPSPRMNSRERKRFCPPTLTPTYYYKTITPTFDPYGNNY